MPDSDDFGLSRFVVFLQVPLVNVVVMPFFNEPCRVQVADDIVDLRDEKKVFLEVHHDGDSHDTLFAELESEIVFLVLAKD